MGYLQEKLDELIKCLTNLIARRAKEGTHATFLEFEAIKKKIGEEPDNIEKLTEMRDYMQDLPNLLEKIKIDMNKTFDIYKSLEEFNYRFTNE